MLGQIENDFFGEAGLDKASRTEGDERRTYRLAQVERLLTEKHGSSPLAMWLSDEFWTAGEGRNPMYENDPLMTLAGQQTLTDREMNRLRLILEIAGLCHDVSLHFTFDLKEAFGFRNGNFWVTNRGLVEWLNTMKYESIAMHTAYIMKKHAIGVYEYAHYLPAQDELAELYSGEHHCLVGRPEDTEIPPRDYVQIILDALLSIERHWHRGVSRLKLSPDLVMLHDEIYGVIPRQFDRGVLKGAQVLYDYMDKNLYGRLTQIGRKHGSPYRDKQSESAKRASAEVLGRFADKVREVRSEYFANGWIEDDSLSFSYLMAHAERCGYGWWREEDEAL